jgi:Raf kinase inhibitor-like YbhB/YbcL family protein
MDFELTSTAFQQGKSIPPEYTADGLDKSPPLKWSEPPDGTKSLALVCEDPDAPKGTFPHWVVFNVPPATRELGEGIPQEPELANGTVQGSNGMGRVGYAGPAPPRGKPHHYFFKLYALDTELGLQPGATLANLRSAIPGHVLAESQLMGLYGR